MSLMQMIIAMNSFWQEIHQFDQEVTLAINGWHTGFTDEIMKVFSDIEVWIPMYVITVGFLFWRLGWKKALIVTASAALAFGMCDQFSNLIKDAVGRVRPCSDEFMLQNGIWLLENPSRSFGFFSAHAANSFSFAVTTFTGFRNDRRLKYRGYAAWIFFWAFMVSASRIFVGKHYCGDVIVGAIVGVAFGLFTAWLARRAIRFIYKKAAGSK